MREWLVIARLLCLVAVGELLALFPRRQPTMPDRAIKFLAVHMGEASGYRRLG